MTPEEKALELVNKFKQFAYANTRYDDEVFEKTLLSNASRCALIAVDEMLLEVAGWKDKEPFWLKVREFIKKSVI